ncbi:MAG: LysM peptidoglycan-binding domain-containing protein [Elusimicrobiota bacterium]
MIKKIISLLMAVNMMSLCTCDIDAKEFFEPKTREEIPYNLLEIEVQEGDTLHSFAQKYLNDPARWPELLEYNKIPSGNPNLLLPGDMVKVPAEMVKDEIADIFYMKNNVRSRRKNASTWKDAKLYQRLFPEDGVRTAANSFAKIKYLKGGRASIGENSLVFLRPEKMRDNVVSLELGELTARDVKVLTASASIDPQKDAEYTASVDEEKTTRLSVIKGKVDFISSGEIVTVNEGFMSMAELNAPPTKPIKLPDPPKFQDLETGGSEITENRKKMNLNDLDAEYILEKLAAKEQEEEKSQVTKPLGRIDKIHIQVSQDMDFSRIVIDRIVEKAAPELWKEQLEDGTYWWRAAFVTKSGMQGQYSAAVELEVENKLVEINIISPEDGAEIKKQILTVKGKAEKDTAVTVNGNAAVLYEDGTFVAAVHIEPGPNKITAVVRDYDGRTASESITVMGAFGVLKSNEKKISKSLKLDVIYPQGDEKIAKSIIVVQGKTKPGNLVTINGDHAVVEEDGGFMLGVNLKPGKNRIIIESFDAAGNRRKVPISVICTLQQGIQQGGESGRKLGLNVTSPENGDVITKRIIMIRGTAVMADFIIVNDSSAVKEEGGGFISAVYLKPGENIITIKAVDSEGNEIIKEIKVQADIE